MHEILRRLPAGSFVLDLGCDQGSFDSSTTAARVIRFDLDAPRGNRAGSAFVRGNASALPFPDRTFAAVISNHSLEHFDDLDGALREIGRVVSPAGALFVAVPDASTFTDKLYRWLARGGGHVNAFTSSDELASVIERTTVLRHVATTELCSSLSFLNRRNSPRPLPRRLILLGGGYEWSLFLYVWASRRLDRLLHLRTRIYGWALYFGSIAEAIDTRARVNVCIRCGSGTAGSTLEQKGLLQSILGFKIYRCPCCGAPNPFARD